MGTKALRTSTPMVRLCTICSQQKTIPEIFNVGKNARNRVVLTPASFIKLSIKYRYQAVSHYAACEGYMQNEKFFNHFR